MPKYFIFHLKILLKTCNFAAIKKQSMKVLRTFCLFLLASCMFWACNSNASDSTDNESKDETKIISANKIQCEGKHADLIKVMEDAQLILAPADNGTWKIQLLIPMSNVKNWNDWNREMNEKQELPPNLEYEACMGMMRLALIASNGDTLNCPMTPVGDYIESLLTSEIMVTEDFLAESTTSGDYKTMKAIFKQTKKIAFTHMDLNIVERSVANNTLGADSENINFDEIYKQAKRTYDEEMRKPADKN